MGSQIPFSHTPQGGRTRQNRELTVSGQLPPGRTVGQGACLCHLRLAFLAGKMGLLKGNPQRAGGRIARGSKAVPLVGKLRHREGEGLAQRPSSTPAAQFCLNAVSRPDSAGALHCGGGSPSPLQDSPHFPDGKMGVQS